MSQEYFDHPLIKKGKLEKRLYQETIFHTTVDNNTLVVLPTGMGKTVSAVLLAAHRLNKKGGKVLFLAPTKPLVEQHRRFFARTMEIGEGDLRVLTGETRPAKREKEYEEGMCFFATPQCVTGDAEIFLPEQGPTTMEEFFETLELEEKDYHGKKAEHADINESILGFDGSKISQVQATDAWKMDAERLIKIDTDMKNTLTCTPEHPLLSLTSQGKLRWVEAEKLQKGDVVAMARSIDIETSNTNLIPYLKEAGVRLADKEFVRKQLEIYKEKEGNYGKFGRFKWNTIPLSELQELIDETGADFPQPLLVTNSNAKSDPIKLPQELTPKLCYLVGAMLGDGHIGDREGHGCEVVFSGTDYRELKEKYMNVVKKFGIEPVERDKGLVSYSTVFGNVLRSLGVPPGKKAGKIRVPTYIFTQPARHIYAFLCGLFETDGGVSSHMMSFSTISQRLSRDLKWLLLRLGIQSSVSVKKREKGKIMGKETNQKDLYTLCISGQKQLENLLQNLNPIDEKIKPLQVSMQGVKKPYSRSKDILPVTEGIRVAYKEHKENGGKALSEVRDAYNRGYNSKTRVSETLKKLESGKAGNLEELLYLPIRWVRVKGIEEQDGGAVYDLTVKEHHNYLTNTLVSHNTAQNDVIAGRMDLDEFTLVIFDECHRAVGDYPYPFIAELYMRRASDPRILGLTASPGGSKWKIQKVMDNLYMDEVEIRTEKDKDVMRYTKPIKKNWKKIELPEEFKEVKLLLEKALERRTKKLKKWEIAPTTSKNLYKKDLLKLQSRLRKKLGQGETDKMLYAAISKVAEALKIEHGLMLLETQGSTSLYEYLKRLRKEAQQGKTRAAKSVMKDGYIATAFRKTSTLLEKGIEHPKLDALARVVEDQLLEKEDSKIIVFSHYRDQVSKIKKELRNIDGCEPVGFIGQAGEEGLSQRKQVEILRQFEEGEHNTLIATSVHPKETIILKSPQGEVLVKEIGNFVDSLLENKGADSKKIQSDWKVFTTDGENTFFSPVTQVHRHRRQNEVFKSKLNSCGDFIVTGNHSIFSFDSEGDHTPARPEKNTFTNVAIEAPLLEGEKEIDLAKILESELPDSEREKFYLTFQNLDQPRIREMNSERKFLTSVDEESWIEKISQDSGLDPSTVNNVRKRLEEKGYIKSEPEGRKRTITLTDKGRKYREFLEWFKSNENYYKGKYRIDLESVAKAPLYFREFCNLQVERAYGKSSVPRFLEISTDLGKFLGYFVSEGSVRNNRKGGELLLTSCQGGKIKEEIKKSVEKGLKMRAESHSHGIFIYSRLIYYLIKYVFKCGTTTVDKKVPSVVFSAPKKVKNSFLRAYFEGDGYSREDRIVFSTISRKLATGLNFLLRQLGIRKISIRRETRNKANARDIYRIEVYESLDFKEIKSKSGKRTYYDLVPRALTDEKIYAKCKNKYIHPLGRKSCRKMATPKQNSSFDYIRNNKRLRKQPKYVYDLSVEGTERFFGGAGLACLHNSVGEEGLDIPAVDLVVFYEPVSSEIRSIQRRGRTGRQKKGNLTVLMAKDTRDEAYYWKSKHRERRMKEALKEIKASGEMEKQKGLEDFD